MIGVPVPCYEYRLLRWHSGAASDINIGHASCIPELSRLRWDRLVVAIPGVRGRRAAEGGEAEPEGAGSPGTGCDVRGLGRMCEDPTMVSLYSAADQRSAGPRLICGTT